MEALVQILEGFLPSRLAMKKTDSCETHIDGDREVTGQVYLNMLRTSVLPAIRTLYGNTARSFPYRAVLQHLPKSEPPASRASVPTEARLPAPSLLPDARSTPEATRIFQHGCHKN
ncbi:hypothetical protein ANN_06783 [Periplaneta americana]|uniref:Uncharacterized protein n=1 Tax=Periplaneta americana TaxID=6978 RepID=A0ABQ8TEM1_PERAM|nr:hypothetical protein ANN_06783 [Periplaneta americana]